MRNLIRHFLPSKKPNSEVSTPTYQDHLRDAIAFTTAEGFALDRPSGGAIPDALTLRKIASDVSQGLYGQIAGFRHQKRSVPMALGGDCGNVHYLIAKFLQNELPGLEANFVLGNVSIDSVGGFEFSEEKFKRWRREVHGGLYDCHSWIAFGSGLILDATIATWINTRRHNKRTLGGILYGAPGALSCTPIADEPHEAIPPNTEIEYTPVALGLDAFFSVAKQ